MRLIVTDDANQDLSFDTVVMPASEFNNICSHPYIASAGFDAIVVDLRCNVKLGFLSKVASITIVIPKVIGDLNAYSVSILTELYRERSAELRYTYMKDKQKFAEIVSAMEEEFHWKDFY